MKQQQKLTFSMALFFLIVFVFFGTIILNEKKEQLFMPKIENKLNKYFEENYKELKNTTTTSISLKDKEYIMTIKSNQNEKLYFTINYKDKNITDTYQEDYIKGTRFLKYLEKEISNEIKNITNKEYKITILTSLDSMTTKVKEKVITEQNISSLKIYTLETEIPIENWNQDYITTKLTNLINNIESNQITPKNYTITIINKNNIYESIKINNLTKKIIENNLLKQIINDILNNVNSELLKQENITFKYLN